MANYNDKTNMEMLKLICDATKLLAELEKIGGITLLNWGTSRKVKKTLKIEGFLNNYDAFSVNGLSLEEARILLKKNGIETTPLQDTKGYFALTIKRKDFNKLSDLEKKIAAGQIDLKKFFEDPENYDLHNSVVKEEIDDEIILDSEEITEEEFQSADLIETDADLEAVIENIENEKDQAISENDIIDNSVFDSSDRDAEKDNAENNNLEINKDDNKIVIDPSLIESDQIASEENTISNKESLDANDELLHNTENSEQIISYYSDKTSDDTTSKIVNDIPVPEAESDSKNVDIKNDNISSNKSEDLNENSQTSDLPTNNSDLVGNEPKESNSNDYSTIETNIDDSIVRNNDFSESDRKNKAVDSPSYMSERNHTENNQEEGHITSPEKESFLGEQTVESHNDTPLSHSEQLAEREKAEREAVLAKEMERKRQKENYTVTEVGTGSALFTSYSDHDVYKPENNTAVASYADHRDISFNSNNSPSTNKHNTSTTLSKNINANSSGYSTLQKPQIDERRYENVTFNKMTLINRYDGNVTTNMVQSFGTLIVGSVEEGYRESIQGQGKAQMAGASAFINNIGYGSLAENKKEALFRKTQREINSGDGSYARVDLLLKQKGYKGLDFSTKKNADSSIQDLYKVLERSGLANNRDGNWDLTKFDRLYKKAKRTQDFSDIGRAMGLSQISRAEMKVISDQIHKLGKRDSVRRRAIKDKHRTGKSLRSMTYHKMGQDSMVLSGYLELKQAVNSVRATARAAKLVIAVNGKPICKVVKGVYRLTGSGANSRILRDTIIGKGYNDVDGGFKKVKNVKVNFDENRRLKKDEKLTKKEKKNTEKKKKAERKKELKKAQFSSLAAKWNKFAPGFLRTDHFILKSANKTVKFAERSTKRINSSIRGIFSAIGTWNNIKAYGKKVLIFGLAAAFLISMGLYSIFVGIGTVVSSLSFGDDEESVDNILDSSMGKTYTKLQAMETKWTDSLLNDTQGIDLGSYNLKYGPSYKSAEDYIPESDAARIFWTQHNVKWNGISGFTANPFGNFEIENDNTASFMNNINGGTELLYKTADGSFRTSNIKEIICMTDIYTMYSTEATDTHEGEDLDGSQSTSEKRSGATYAASSEVISAADRKKTSKVFLAYAQDLFNMSHQEIIDLEYVILPTKMTVDTFDPDTELVEGENNATVKVTQCPDYDLGGCQIYENFYYDEDGIAVKDKNGTLHTVGGVYPLMNSNTEFNIDDSENIINTEYCFADSVDEFNDVYNDDNKDCWQILYIPESSDSDSVEDYESPDDSDYSDEIRSLIGDNEKVTSFYWDNEEGYFVLTTEKEGDTWTDVDYEKVIDSPTGWHYAITSTTYTDVDYNTYHVIHECAGNHHGRYCGGHLKAKITGVVYGFSDSQIDADDNGSDILGKVEDGEYTHRDRSKFTLENKNVFLTATDIFDIDNACTHPSEREDWEGWTSENIEMCMVKYNMDWEDLYGLNISSSLGGQSLTTANVSEIMGKIKEAYPDLSDERLAVIERGLGYVGKIGYSQSHHACPLDGPCGHDGGSPCYLSDCSGYVSNLWKDRIGMQTTASLWGIVKDQHRTYSSVGAQPGDIFVHYEGAIADGRGDHALLYIGNFEYDGVTQDWTLDCSTVKGVGNVFLRHRNYYDSCYVVSPDGR